MSGWLWVFYCWLNVKIIGVKLLLNANNSEKLINMLQKIIKIVFFLSLTALLTIFSVVFGILKRVPEIIFYMAGFYIPFSLVLIISGIMIFGKHHKLKNWLIMAINIVNIVIAFIYLQKALMVR